MRPPADGHSPGRGRSAAPGRISGQKQVDLPGEGAEAHRVKRDGNQNRGRQSGASGGGCGSWDMAALG
jgi:hypothetical protein